MRFLIASAAGLSIALLLFVLMNALISGEAPLDRSSLDGSVVDFIRVREDEIAQFKERERPEEPPPPVEPPTPPTITVAENERPTTTPPAIDLPNIAAASTGSGPYLGQWTPGDAAADGDIVPLVQIPPQYPREAALDGTEGWVRLGFTILPDGSVADPEVLDSMPRRVFDRSAITAILRWQFRPRIVAGEAVPRRAELTLDYTLSE